MSKSIFQQIRDLQQDLPSLETEGNTARPPFVTPDSGDKALTETGGTAIWHKLFGLLLDKTKDDTEAKAPDGPETTPEQETPQKENPPTDTAGQGDSLDPDNVVRQIAPVILDGGSVADVAGGRVTTFALPDAANVTAVAITGLPAHGNVTVNPDFTLALVLSGSDYSGPLSFDYTISKADGTVTTHTARLDVATPTQEAGWGLGDHYMLATDADDKIVVEHGDNHRKVYISASEDALTRADIAAIAGVSESVITAQWLRNNPDFGGSEDMALATDVGMELWDAITAPSIGPASHWLLFERDYTYEDLGRLTTRGSNGESELAPLLVSSWGTGARPILDTKLSIFQLPSSNYVIRDVEITQGARVLGGDSILFESVKFGDESAFQSLDGLSAVTIRYSEITDIAKDSPTHTNWAANADRKAGIFTSGISGLLLENNLALHNGWTEGYDGAKTERQPPSAFSHNFYINPTTTDVTFRDNITAQGASMGASLAGGAFAEGNVFLDNNIGVAINAIGVDTGNFTLFIDNLITSAGRKDAPDKIGARDWGISENGKQTALYNNIIAHSANPDDPDEVEAKGNASQAIGRNDTRFFNDTIVHNWTTAQQSIGDLDPIALNQITIQNFALEFLALDPNTAPANEDMGLYYKSGLIYALMDYARDNWADGTLTTDEIIDWFQAGFGFDPRPQGASDHRFVPNDLGDGIRWDNRLNWTSNERPDDGDKVDLGGNWVNYGGTVALDSLDLGTGGKLKVGSGKLTVDTLDAGAKGMVFVERGGQIWTDGYEGTALLSLQITGGRFANTGDISGPVIASVQGGQMLLATDDAQFILGQQSELRLEGAAVKAGFDGSVGGVATLLMQAGGQMSFVADGAGLASVQEFRSGAWDQAGSNVHSGVALDGTLALDLSDYIGIGNMNLIKVDAIAGIFDEINIHGLGSNRDAELVIDYAADLVSLQLSSGTGQGRVTIMGDADYGDDEDAGLWDALTSERDAADDLNVPITIFDEVIDPLAEMNFI